jgi:hypothetical protein
LHFTYIELNNGQYPHGHCRQIEIFAISIKQNFKKILGVDAERLGNLFMAAHEVELLFAEIGNSKIDKKELIKIEESSGEFPGASRLILF